MSILKDIYNWLAMRNLGQMMGMKWDPTRDEKYQRRRLTERASSWAASLDQAEKQLLEGNFRDAGFTAYRVIQSIPEAGLPITHQVRARARAIIAKLPSDFVPPDPMPTMIADVALDMVAKASKLMSDGRAQEASTIMNTVLTHQIEDGEKVLAGEAYIAAFALVATMPQKPKPSE